MAAEGDPNGILFARPSVVGAIALGCPKQIERTSPATMISLRPLAGVAVTASGILFCGLATRNGLSLLITMAALPVANGPSTTCESRSTSRFLLRGREPLMAEGSPCQTQPPSQPPSGLRRPLTRLKTSP